MSKHTYVYEAEEFLGYFYAYIEIDFTYYPGEPMIWRTPNGDGYPGSSAMVELTNARVLRLIGDTYEKDRALLEKSGWAEYFDALALEYVQDELDKCGYLLDELFEEVANAHEVSEY